MTCMSLSATRHPFALIDHSSDRTAQSLLHIRVAARRDVAGGVPCPLASPAETESATGASMKADAFRYDGKRARGRRRRDRHGRGDRRAGAGPRRRGRGDGLRAGDPRRREGDQGQSRDKASIDAAVDECGGPIDALFSCAGVADGTPGIEKINFIGHRHLIDRVIEQGYLGRGGAIGMISSTAGLGWEANLDAGEGVPRHPRLRRRGGVDRGAPRARRLHVEQADHQRRTWPARRSTC